MANADQATAGQATVLSEGTLSLLQGLDSPVEVRFYAVLDPASVSDALPAFAGRVDQLLSEYQRAADGKVKVTRYDSRSDANAAATAASADGIQPFNLDKGEACFLGIAVASGTRKESLPRLAPEWEPALEADLSRAIGRVAAPKPAASPFAANPLANKAAIEAVRRTIPDVATVSVEEGTRILREAGLKEFKAAAAGMEAQAQQAQQRLSQAQHGGSTADQQTAMKHLQQVQAEQADQLKQIAARSQAQIEAFKRLKETTR